MVKEAKVVHIQMKCQSTVTRLVPPIRVKNYVVGLMTIHGQFDSKKWKSRGTMYLCCDVCEPSHVNTSTMPILCSIVKANGQNIRDVGNVVWLKTNADVIQTIETYLVDENYKMLSDTTCNLNCTLVFIPL